MAARWESLVHTPLTIRCRVRAALRDSSRPILVGPWCSEVGFELLYWIPFLRKTLGDAGIDPARVIAASRGGAEPWYSGIADTYYDLMDAKSHAEYLSYTTTREAQQGVKKQLDLVACERALINELSSDFEDPVVFHPSLMYRLFAAVWRGMKPVEYALERCHHVPMDRNLPLPEGCPFGDEPYAAIKLYRSDAWPQNESSAAFVRDLLASLASRMPVVVLQAGFDMDDHRDHSLPDGVRIIDASPWIEPRTNLAVQSAIVAHASELHTTYGGFAYLGALLGVPTTAYYSNDGFVADHLQVSNQIFSGPGFAAIRERRIVDGALASE